MNKLISLLLLTLFLVSIVSAYIYLKVSNEAKPTQSVKVIEPKFAVYYGCINSTIIQVLNNFSWVIIDPTQVNSSQLNQIKAVKIAYIDLGELANMSLGNLTPPTNVTIGYDQLWDQYIVNISSPSWQKYIESQVTTVISMGFQGVMFDDVDVVEQYPFVTQGIISIINWTRSHYPNIIIGINRGFSLVENISKMINFVLFEDYGTQVVSPGQIFFSNSSFVIQETKLLKSYNLTVLALGYANYPGDIYWNTVKSLAASEGVSSFVGNWNLSVIWLQNLSDY
ncbi:endo alpha-1,4 polygalactosaminidase [Sulfurisphaera ohwakuensis]|uniref:endo alpha-1,4 polygalactosaminidase n=1 Tax=Sulfurisphaera ohwakuensis TaxID=69656 RepID=UPI0036F30128